KPKARITFSRGALRTSPSSAIYDVTGCSCPRPGSKTALFVALSSFHEGVMGAREGVWRQKVVYVLLRLALQHPADAFDGGVGGGTQPLQETLSVLFRLRVFFAFAC